MDRAQPKNLTKADILRAKKNVERVKLLFERGKTPGQLMTEMIEMISLGPRHSRDHKRP